ncbi:MAG: adenylate/guanylate cyclase domain-containing protein [Rhodopseudomonas palustris]|uniref:Adenylate/guanylate cyclase domain-containing protein n=1 Tax=Rhodopseudomonas palustris TaxID=1076 RepID=A0A933RWR2_RHOPL|nr:adenylate/guanylate cyclase domain-containing protein [Rhodopseudomonas palustris]
MAGVLASWPALDVARGLSLDLLTATRWYAFGPRADASARPAVVVAIDEESYQTPPFKGSPTLTWTREIGRVLTAILDGGAKVVGFDIVFPTSIEQSQIPFGDEPLGARMRGFDRDFLRALASGAAAGRVVLGEISQRGEAIGPSPAQRVAVRQQQNIRALNVYVDRDDVVRRLPLSFASEAGAQPSLAVELAARARGVAPAFRDGGLDFGGRIVAGSVPNTLTLNFDGGAKDIATYSMADLRACAEAGNRDFFLRQFDGKVVIIGTLLNLEDRKLTSKRFATGLEGAHAPRCVLPQPATSVGQFRRNSIAGVYIHATAVNNLLAGGPVVELGRWPVTLAAIGFAAVVAVAALLLSPVVAAFGYLGLTAALLAVATAVFARSVALPLSEPVVAGFGALVLMIGYRFVVVDRTERFLRQSFGLYLAPQVIEQMVSSQTLPKLGGEMRHVTVFFSDVAGFSTVAEQLTPDALVELMNAYLSAMTDIIERHGGYVDKYIGDSIVAVFGAPVDDPDHAVHAVRAALACRERLDQLNASAAAFRGHKLGHRIGLNSGEALVGNIGSRRRFNYTVMSDTVNLASRLEGANKYFDTSILASEMTVSLTGAAFDWRELDAIRVKGRTQPVKIYEPLAEAGRTPADQAAIAQTYADGLAHWRARDFAGAEQAFAAIAARDPPAALFLARARHHAAHPPGEGWEPVHTLEGK